MKDLSKSIKIGIIFVFISEGFGINLDLPSEFLPYYFQSFPNVAKECLEDPSCPYKMHLDKNVCWGYEDKCVGPPKNHKYSHPICDGHHKGWVKTKKEQVETFFNQADFGYVKDFRNSMKMICQPDAPTDSSLECSENLTFCRARNIMIDFRRLINRTEPVMYDMDVLSKGEIGGHCKLRKSFLSSQVERMSSLQSWAPELQHFVELPSRPFDQDSKLCDRIIKTPTFIMKIDATVNMYHHFCDFFNLYASLFVNETTNNPEMFTKNVRVAIWRTFKYSSSFESTFRAFTSYPIMDLNDFKGKRVCFQNAVFPLLPRMIFGLFYNTPLIWGCRDSGLFRSFSQFILHRLRIDPKPELNLKKIKVTFISRLTKFRRVLNEEDILEELQKNENLIVEKVTFTWKTDFIEQLRIIQDTDILIGMHGAGLTHSLFLPDWAAVFELYNCGDENCYADLARLRGLKYITWRNKDLLQEDKDLSQEFGPGHEKHSNYLFNTSEFVSLVNEAIAHLKAYSEKHYTHHDEL